MTMKKRVSSHKKNRICFIRTLDKISGGNIYDNMVYEILKNKYEVDILNIKKRNRFLKEIYVLKELLSIKGEKDVWVRRIISTITLPYDKTQGKNLVIFHHLDNSIKRQIFINKILEKLFYSGLKKADIIVTVSKYWQKYLLARGYKNVYVIYNAFNTEEFKFKKREINEFKKKYKLDKKPIVYIGNCQESKGVKEVYKTLKNLDVYIVTSGKKQVDVPSINFNLNYREYLLLLKASSVVVTMSKFKEGWCRTAHETMLCKTPVIGSGLGGMKELLEGGNQIICQDMDKIKSHVNKLINNKNLSKSMGDKGYEYAKKFSKKRFEKEWSQLIREKL